MRFVAGVTAGAAGGLALTGFIISGWISLAGAAGPGGAKPAAATGFTYVGSQKCAECHEENFQRFIKHSPKSRSYRSIRRMERGLTSREKRHCYDCHTTGHGRPGGFVSLAKTPQLKNIGCESCHGPGSGHVKNEDKKQIRRRVPLSTCQKCHVSARIKAFKHVPLTYGGAH
jgi:hypothetical protein